MSKVKPTYYAIIPASVRYDEDLTANAKLLYAEITVLTQTNGICWASDNYFMDLYKVERQTVQRWLKSLEDKGYIVREVVYKKGSKEIEKRFIKVYTEMLQGYAQNSDKGMHNNVTDNTTSINITSTNIKPLVENEEKDEIPYQRIISYLNKETGKAYRNVGSNKKIIKARYNQGYDIEDFKTVIDNKVSDWKGTDYEKYLQPSTLFGNKFDQYLNQTPKEKKIKLNYEEW